MSVYIPFIIFYNIVLCLSFPTTHYDEKPIATTESAFVQNPDDTQKELLTTIAENTFDASENSAEEEICDDENNVFNQWNDDYIFENALKNYYNRINEHNIKPSWQIPQAKTEVHSSLSEIPKFAYNNHQIRQPKNFRVQRGDQTHHDDVDYWNHLELNSKIQNFLPTMPPPYFREAYDSSEVPYTSVRANFPYNSKDCSVPILLQCSPQVFNGRIVVDDNGKVLLGPYY